MQVKENAARLFRRLEDSQAHQLRQRALESPARFVQLAHNHGYSLHLKNLAEEVAALSTDALAAIFTPGVGPRRHLIRR
ncbi:Nif11-like leader peptide family natural product precursor [Lyngbya confervoides]|uniref:Nif11 domain-containing protein n=1 Tax=Lyngbya confervoides BDU141951 TaxID=1574623 RepID=A0ABD4T035_9CYAN|nr:Nif11-like leader peptide family natural product precursor [Lyngbya confervoides]MCM1982021.1 hypothetical protein [Lyngbya confervoides BDU141951]